VIEESKVPNKVVQIKGKYRLIEKDTGRLVKNAEGTAVDGGGHESKEKAVKQLQAIAIHRKKK